MKQMGLRIPKVIDRSFLKVQVFLSAKISEYCFRNFFSLQSKVPSVFGQGHVVSK